MKNDISTNSTRRCQMVKDIPDLSAGHSNHMADRTNRISNGREVAT